MKKQLLSILGAGFLMLSSIQTFAQIVLLVQSPSNLAGSYNFTYSSSNSWGADMDTVALTAQAAFAYDATSADSLGCETIVNTGDVAGKIAVIYRGTCNFSLKALNAQDAGAVACVIINNVSGGPVGMGAGSFSADVTIPVVMISDVDGALLRDDILAGNVTMFLGNNTGLFANNVGVYNAHIAMAKSASLPVQFAESSTDFFVPIGAWVHNYGSADATNVVVSATVDIDGTELYSETSSPGNIPVGDSLLFALDDFSLDGYDPGVYTITYTITSDNSDEFPDDNEITSTFWINEEGIYSKSRVSPTDGPLGSNGLRPANGTEFQWCVMMRSENASAMAVTGITFNTLGSTIDLTGEAVQLALYEWNDPFDGTVAPTFDDLNELTDNEFYDYADDLQGEFVTHTFAEPIELTDDTKYLACATIFTADMFLGVDQGLDYNVTYDGYPTDIFFPLNDIDGSTWYSGGFGTDNVPAIIVNLTEANGIAEDIEALNVTPYPNPTVDRINIPFGVQMSGTVNVHVYDVAGKLVMTDELCLKNNSSITMDVTALTTGLHTFELTFEDNSTTSFRVVVTK